MKTGLLNYFGFVSDTFGFYPTGKNAHNAAERDVTVYQIAGRNGDLFVDNGRYKNIEVTYPCFTVDFAANEQKIRNMVAVHRDEYGYLSDTYDETHYRLGRLVGGIEFEPVRGNAANFDLTFDCDPRRFLKTGDDEIPIENGGDTIENPTIFEARPLIWVENITEGTVIEVSGEDGKVYTLTATDDFADVVYIDSERQDVYVFVGDDVVNRNDLFEIPDGFPVLTWGFINITISGGYDAAAIAPRWWEL